MRRRQPQARRILPLPPIRSTAPIACLVIGEPDSDPASRLDPEQDRTRRLLVGTGSGRSSSASTHRRHQRSPVEFYEMIMDARVASHSLQSSRRGRCRHGRRSSFAVRRQRTAVRGEAWRRLRNGVPRGASTLRTLTDHRRTPQLALARPVHCVLVRRRDDDVIYRTPTSGVGVLRPCGMGRHRRVPFVRCSHTRPPPTHLVIQDAVPTTRRCHRMDRPPHGPLLGVAEDQDLRVTTGFVRLAT